MTAPTQTLREEIALTVAQLEREQQKQTPADQLQSKLVDLQGQLAEADAAEKLAHLVAYLPGSKARMGAAARELNVARDYFRNAVDHVSHATIAHDVTVQDEAAALTELDAAAPGNGRINPNRPFVSVDSSQLRPIGSDVCGEIAGLVEPIFRRFGYGLIADSMLQLKRGSNPIAPSPFMDIYPEDES